MPPKASITKEVIQDAAFGIARENGLDALSARTIAQKLGCSTQPIYSVYGNMSELREDVYQRALVFANDWMTASSRDEGNSPALNLAIGFLRFAVTEKWLFRTVYLSGVRSYDLDKDGFIGQQNILLALQHSRRVRALPEEGVKRIFRDLMMYVIGLAAMMNANTVRLDVDEAVEMVRAMYEILLSDERRRIE